MLYETSLVTDLKNLCRKHKIHPVKLILKGSVELVVDSVTSVYNYFKDAEVRKIRGEIDAETRKIFETPMILSFDWEDHLRDAARSYYKAGLVTSENAYLNSEHYWQEIDKLIDRKVAEIETDIESEYIVLSSSPQANKNTEALVNLAKTHGTLF